MRFTVVLVLAFACQSSDVSRQVGARCDESSQCDERCLGPDGNFPGGFCTISCDHSTDCPDDTACVDDDGGACLFRCLANSDCTFLGTGWACKPESERGNSNVQVSVCAGG
ncbi:MAG TPA: hypothetical protein VGO00_17860 [Kofleriaceae bacterium]|nr:hypothetical protein [Kofleriaceae bacterium]